MTITTDLYKRQLLDDLLYVPPRLLGYYTTFSHRVNITLDYDVPIANIEHFMYKKRIFRDFFSKKYKD